jgi:hypothetical protein
MAYRVCSECGADLAGKPAQAKTCSSKCRSTRSRRLKRVKRENGEANAYPEELKEVSERVRGESPDVAHRIIEEELRPVVRESITADTLQAIADMVALTPTAVDALREDLTSHDATIRQRAYTLLMKYTVGHHAIVQPPEQDRSQALQVNFNLPRPKDQPEGDPAITAEVVEEERVCDTCGKNGPASEFVAGSDRCTECFAKQQAQLSQLNADD